MSPIETITLKGAAWGRWGRESWGGQVERELPCRRLQCAPRNARSPFDKGGQEVEVLTNAAYRLSISSPGVEKKEEILVFFASAARAALVLATRSLTLPHSYREDFKVTVKTAKGEAAFVYRISNFDGEWRESLWTADGKACLAFTIQKPTVANFRELDRQSAGAGLSQAA